MPGTSPSAPRRPRPPAPDSPDAASGETATRGTEPLRLTDQLCFALYQATNAVVRTYRPLLRAIGLTYPQYLLMMALWERDDVALGELAARLDLPLHGLSPVLERLRQQGLVDKERDPSDRRTLRVRLTDRGRDLEVEAARAQQQVVCRTGLSADATARLRGSLHGLTDELDDDADDRAAPEVPPDAGR